MKLQTYLKKQKVRYSVWGVKNGIHPSILHRFLKKDGRLSAGVALRIQKATRGAVPLKELIK